ncbi:MAG: DUF1540 domain-containing protein [Sumerlaeia bacterium]
MNTSHVKACSATDCAYNKSHACHAQAITVQDDVCLTYAPANLDGGNDLLVAKVGACKTTSCVNNKNLLCQAKEINLGMRNSQVSCQTYVSN